jgi:hypothetical protein
MSLRQKRKRRIELLPLLDPPPVSHRWVGPTARDIGGMLLARAPDLLSSMKAVPV